MSPRVPFRTSWTTSSESEPLFRSSDPTITTDSFVPLSADQYDEITDYGCSGHSFKFAVNGSEASDSPPLALKERKSVKHNLNE